MMGDSGSDEDYPLLIEQGRCCPDAHGLNGKSRNPQSYWSRFRHPSPSWVICIFAIYEFIFGILLVPELNATFALICHQRYSASQTRPGDPPQARDLLGELEHCFANEHAQSDLSRFIIYGQATAGLLGAISTPILGSLSDRVGRKPILACAAIGPLLYEAIMVLVLRYPDSVDMHWLLVGYAMEGLSGTMITATSSSQAYIADLAPPSARARLFSYLQAAMSFAGAVGPVIAGLLLTMPNALEMIYWLAVGAHISLTLVFLFVLPESRSLRSSGSPDRDGSTLEQPPGESYVRVFVMSLNSLWESSVFQETNTVILAGMDLIIFGIMIGLPALQLAYPAFLFEWQPTTQSFFVSLISSWSILVLVLLFPLVMTRVRRRTRRMSIPNMSAAFNVGELGAIQVNLVLQMIGYIGIALAQVPSHFIISSLIVASTASIAPLLTSCLTARMPVHQSGQLLGVLSFLHAIARIVIPAVLNATYSMTIGIFPAPLFVLLSIIIGMLLLASMYIKTNTL